MLNALAPVVLDALVRRCAPNTGPLTMAALVMHESGARPNAIFDDTGRRAYDAADAGSARDLAVRLISMGHVLDIGIAQLNTANVRAYGLSVADAFDPCTNVRVAATILRRDYAAAARAYGPGQRALAHAFSAYNSGSLTAAASYADGVRRDAADFARSR